MRRYASLVILPLLIVLLSGCGVSYYRKYTYTPPTAPGTDRCISQCWTGRNACQQICALKNPTCAREAAKDANTRYNDYLRQQQAKGLPIKKSLKDFQRTAQCRHSCNCIPAFNMCYTACGGYVS